MSDQGKSYITIRELHEKLVLVDQRVTRLEAWVKYLGPVLVAAVLSPKVGGPDSAHAAAVAGSLEALIVGARRLIGF